MSPPQLQITPSNDTTICIDGSATLSASASGGTGGYAIHWDQGLPPQLSVTVSPSIPTTYNVFFTDANNCSSDTVPIQVDILDSLQVVVPDTIEICAGDAVTITAAGSGGNGNHTHT